MRKTVLQLVVLAILVGGAMIAWRQYGDLLPSLRRQVAAKARIEAAPPRDHSGIPRPGKYSKLDAKAADVWPRADTLEIEPDETLRSFWVDGEKKRFSALVKSHPCDTLVVPVQSQRFGFDRVTRALMTAELARRLAADPARCIVDPFLAARALGEGMRRYDRDAVETLAKSVGAKTIVWTYAGHDDHMNMDFFAKVETVDARVSTPVYRDGASKSWAAIPFSDEEPPFVVWQAKLDDVLKAIGLDVPKPQAAAEGPTPPDLPDAPEQLVATRTAGALDDAMRYELLATLAPSGESPGTERLFEKAFIAAENAADTPVTRRIKARALLHLGYRPAALPLLKDDASSEALVLASLLNGNLPEATQAASTLKEPREQLMATLEIHDLALDYKRSDAPKVAPIVDALRARSNGWSTLLDARLADHDAWKNGDNGAIKRLLDTTWPIDGYSYEEILRGTATMLRMQSEAESELLPRRHIDRLLDEKPERFYHEGFSTSPAESDFLDLLAARSTATLEGDVGRDIMVLGKPDDALALLDALDTKLLGHPHFLALRAAAETQITLMRNDESTGQRSARMKVAARSAAFWEQGLTVTTVTALTASGIPSRTSTPFIEAYAHDYPPKPYWHSMPDGEQSAMSYDLHALAFSTEDPSALAWLVRKPTAVSREKAKNELATRFHGSRDADDLRHGLDPPVGAGDEIASLRARVAEDPGRWDSTETLVDKLIANGNYDEAAKAATAYPGFRPDSGENRVGVSNEAFKVGSQLFWRGATEQAKPLFSIAASSRTGSEAEMLSSQRLALLSGDYVGAARFALERVTRYGDPWAARDYLTFLFAFGESSEAWPAFSQTAARFDNAELWSAALVGHRIEGASTEQFTTWLESDAIRSIRHDMAQPALEAGMNWFLIDRAPYAGLPALLEKVEGTPRASFDIHEEGNATVPNADGIRQPISRSRFRRSEREMPQTKVAVPSAYVLFAIAYEALQRGDNAAAVTAFDHLAGFYSIEGGTTSGMRVALPYFALASAKSGDPLRLHAFLDALPVAWRSLEYHLAEAYFAGIGGDRDGAERELHRALGMFDPNHDATHRLAFQYAETCIRLYDETHEPRYRDMALDYAKRFQHVDPTMAWPYALEARYGNPADAGHLRAVAMAEYLDRESAWLSAVPKAERDRARAWLKHNNPFKQDAGATRNSI